MVIKTSDKRSVVTPRIETTKILRVHLASVVSVAQYTEQTLTEPGEIRISASGLEEKDTEHPHVGTLRSLDLNS